MNNGKKNTPGMLCLINAMDAVSVDDLESTTTDCTLNEIGSGVIQSSGPNTLRDPEYIYGARVQWGRPHDTISAWEDMAVWGMETFGLPGGRYITEININDMIWWFATAQDRLLFVLRNGTVQCIELQLET